MAGRAPRHYGDGAGSFDSRPGELEPSLLLFTGCVGSFMFEVEVRYGKDSLGVRFEA